MKRWLLICCCGLMSVVAFAAPDPAGKRVVEASMLVTGSIVIAPDGSVRSFAVDKPEKLSAAIRSVIDKTVGGWKFVPVVMDGRPVTAQTKMHLRLISAPIADGNYAVRVADASFTGDTPAEYERSGGTAVRRLPPKYPVGALRARVGATVYLLVKVGNHGQVLDATAEQVNLDTLGTVRQMAGLRDAFANASVAAALRWTYPPPTGGVQSSDAYVVMRVPLTFTINRSGARPVDHYGRWQTYVRGPREVVPWLDVAQMPAGGVDTIPDGSVLLLGQGPKLATPVSGD